MKIIVTGAHFTPAQAVIEKLQEYSRSTDHKANINIVYVGRKTTREGDNTPSVESQVLPTLGVKFVPIIAGRLRRSFDIYTFISLLKLPIGFIQSFWIVLKENPDVIVSFGGYIGVPVVISGWLLSKPIIVHEQTLVSGLSNWISNFFATKIAVSFDQPYAFSKNKLILTGNPMRGELVKGEKGKSFDSAQDRRGGKAIENLITKAKREKMPIIYVTGGNQGSHEINKNITEILAHLTQKNVVIHQTGDSQFKDFESLEQLVKEKGIQNYLPQKWFDVEDLKIILANSDLVISRAGANTLLELAYFAIPTLVIPLPLTNKNEQIKNAKYFAGKGLAEIVYQKDLTPSSLQEKIESMLKNIKDLKVKAQGAKSLAKVEAADLLVQQIFTISIND